MNRIEMGLLIVLAGVFVILTRNWFNAYNSMFSKGNLLFGVFMILTGLFVCLPHNDYTEPATAPVNNVVQKVDTTPVVLTPDQIKKVLPGNN